MNKLLLVFVASLTLSVGCTNAKATKKVLRAQGYDKIEITGYRFFACDHKSDFYHTGFKAVSPYGREVSGTVCKGFWFKGSTIRFD